VCPSITNNPKSPWELGAFTEETASVIFQKVAVTLYQGKIIGQKTINIYISG
jgi:hypothetical protein